MKKLKNNIIIIHSLEWKIFLLELERILEKFNVKKPKI